MPADDLAPGDGRCPRAATSTSAAYEARASEYIDAVGSMADVHPSDLRIVETWASTVHGRVLDAGCGPGHWTAHLADLGLDIRGIDLVEGFLRHARAAHPGVRFDRVSIDDIDEDDGAIGGILSWFSTIHHSPSALHVPLSEFARVLRPGGTLVVGFFSGTRVEGFDHAVTRAHRWPLEELGTRLDAADFDVVETHLRTTRGARPVGTIVAERRARAATGRERANAAAPGKDDGVRA